MINKKAIGLGGTFVIVAVAIMLIAGGAGFAFLAFGGVAQEAVGGSCPAGSSLVNGVCVASTTGAKGCPQNPDITSYTFNNALTGASVTANPVNIKDKATGKLLGTDPTVSKDQVLTYLMNASGYIATVQSDYIVACGDQGVSGTLFQFANETIELSSSTGTGTVGAFGGTLGNTGNDTSFVTVKNMNIKLSGNTDKSSGRLYVVLEMSNTKNLSTAELSITNGAKITSITAVPACYAEATTVDGTPYKIAWELPALIGGTIGNYNLQMNPLSGNRVQGQATLTIYNEKDAVDSGNSEFLTSGICDSKNAFYNMDRTVNSFYFN